ncbi:helix-turn-helix domain-containing protein [Sutcliffiella cohnii]
MKSEGLLLSLFIPRSKGACLAHFRNILQLTQSDISNELGINRSSISKMENSDINVSEHVWKHVLSKVHHDFELDNQLGFEDFKDTLEQFIEDEDEDMEEVYEFWEKRKLSSQPEMNI